MHQRSIKTGVIGAIEALKVLMNYQQHSMSRLSIYLPTEVKPTVRVLKRKTHLEELPSNSQDIFHINKFQVYLLHPKELSHITYPDLYKWWRQLLPGEIQRAVHQMEQQLTAALEMSIDPQSVITDKSDFGEYLACVEDRQTELSALKTRIQTHLHSVH